MNAATTFHGTYQWMAPEWIIESESTPKVDVFTLGACFANIVAVVLEGRDGLREIWRIGLESGSCQFAANLEDVLVYLESVKLAHFDPRIEVSKLKFHALLIEWVERMIVREPAGRASMDELQSICNKHDPCWEVVPELSPNRFETLEEVSFPLWGGGVKSRS
jgi:serine/threonine protein kinase